MQDIVHHGFWLALLASGIPLVAIALVGLVLAFIQTVTQVQEASFVHLVKLAVFCAVLIFCGGAVTQLFLDFARQCWSMSVRL